MTAFRARDVSQNVKVLSLCVTVLTVAALAAAVEPARACSCIQPDPWRVLEQADGAFVGRLVSRRENGEGRAVLVFSVERAVKGKIGAMVEVATANNGAACGIETSIGRRIGLFLVRERDGWFGHLCWQVEPEDLLAAASLPAPTGRGSVALFVGGQFGPARTLALDAKGRTLAYGMGTGSVLDFSACPGGRRVAELVALGTPDAPYTSYIVAIREVPTLRLVREQRLQHRYFDTAALRCVKADGEQVIVFRGSGPDLERRARLVRITPTKATTIWQGRAWYASFQGRFAYVQVLARAGTTIVAVDLRTGAAKRLGTVRVFGAYELTVNPAGTRLAGDSYDEARACCPRLHVVDLERHPISLRSIPLPTEFGSHLWLRNDRFAYLVGGEVVVYTPALHISARFSGWNAWSTALLGSRLVGVGRYGQLLGAQLPTGAVRVVRRLPGRADVIVSAKG